MGKYSGSFKLEPDSQLKKLLRSRSASIYLPWSTLIRNLEINGSVVDLSSAIPSTYYDAGSIVSISDYLKPQDNEFNVSFTLDHLNRYPYSGIKTRTPPLIGRASDLHQYLGKKTAYFCTVPILFAFIFLGLFVLFRRYGNKVASAAPILKEWAYCHLSCAIFFVFLSSFVRTWNPQYGIMLHIPARIIFSAAVFRLLARFSRMSERTIRLATVYYLIIVSISVVLGTFELYQYQNFFNTLSNTTLLIPAILFLRIKNKEPVETIISAISFIITLCFINDGIRFIFEFASLNYPFPYVNRHTTPVFLLCSLFYLFERILREERTLSKNEAIFDITAQVIHDIRSPLAVLDHVANQADFLQKELKPIAQKATKRMEEMIHSLALQHEAAGSLREKNAPTHADARISLVIQDVILEKKIQYQHLNHIKIEDVVDESAQSAICSVDISGLKRILSNLVDNSVQAIRGTPDQPGPKERGLPLLGEIKVHLSCKDGRSLIAILDNGHGISLDLIPQLGVKGNTFNKPGGKGLGLFHAKTLVSSWGGDLRIESELNSGTKVTVSLPSTL